MSNPVDNSGAPESVDGTVDNHQRTPPRETFWDRLHEVLKNDMLALLGMVIIVLFIFTSLFAPFLIPYEPDTSYESHQGPLTNSETYDGETGFHLFGTDSLGQDVFTQVIYGTRISLLVAAATVLVGFGIGTTIGLIAGFYGGWVDDLLMRIIDFLWAFPALILAIGIIAYLGSPGVINVIIAISVAFIDDFARIVRGEVLSIREEEYIMASNALGMGKSRIMIREMLPNAVAPIIVQATLLIPIAIIAEAGLSFLGIGVGVQTPTWGQMIGQGRNFIGSSWWISVFPGFAIMAVALAFNMFGDGLRDAFDIQQTEQTR